VSNAERRARKQANKTQAREERYSSWRRARRRAWIARIVIIALVMGLVGGGAVALFGGDSDSADSADSADDATTSSTGPETTTTLSPELAAIECSTDVPESASGERPSFDAPPEIEIDETKKYRATMETSCGTIVFDMDPSDPEQAVSGINNFVFLARQGFYDGLTFHRVVTDFVIQGGDPSGDGTGGPGYDFGSPDDVPQGITYEIGDLAYANSGATESSGSQFFFITGPTGPTALNPQATFIKFGVVTEGLAVAQRIEKLETPGTQAPSQPVYVVKVTVEEV